VGVVPRGELPDAHAGLGAGAERGEQLCRACCLGVRSEGSRAAGAWAFAQSGEGVAERGGGSSADPRPSPRIDPIRDTIDAIRRERDLTIWQIWSRLVDDHGAEVSYSTVAGYIRRADST